MSRTALILLVKFKSPLGLEEVEKVVDSRIEVFSVLKPSGSSCLNAPR